jgi:hypothetical protein
MQHKKTIDKNLGTDQEGKYLLNIDLQLSKERNIQWVSEYWACPVFKKSTGCQLVQYSNSVQNLD